MAQVQNTREIVEAIWRDNLPPSEHEYPDEFFAAGGDSLGATRVLAELQRRFQTQLSMGLIGDGLTIDLLVNALGESTVDVCPAGGALEGWERI